jgi:hypothetical protein
LQQRLQTILISIIKELASEQLGKSFHVFTWLNEVQNATLSIPNPSLSPDPQRARVNDRSFVLREMSLRAGLKEMDRFLKRETSFEERLIYDDCHQYTKQKVYMMLKDEGKTVAALTWKDGIQAKAYEDTVEIFTKAETVFQFFLPSHFEGRTAEKYWGAVHRLLIVSYASY